MNENIKKVTNTIALMIPERFRGDVKLFFVNALYLIQRLKKYNLSLRYGEKSERTLVVMLDKANVQAGMTDRLFVIMGAYYFACRMNRKFKILCDDDFDWNDYFSSAQVDWKCERKDITFSLPYDFPVILPVKNRFFPSFPVNYHVYWQRDIASLKRLVPAEEWSTLFHELFTPTKKTLQLLEQLPLIAGEYVAVHTRFLNSLEQKEYTWFGTPLPIDAQKQLIQEVMSIIKDIRKLHGNGVKLLIAGDSDKFNQMVLNEIPEAVIASSQVGHILHSPSSAIYDAAVKDFMTLSRAKKVYGIVLEHMWKSGYAEFAAQVGGIEYCMVKSKKDVLLCSE